MDGSSLRVWVVLRVVSIDRSVPVLHPPTLLFLIAPQPSSKKTKTQTAAISFHEGIRTELRRLKRDGIGMLLVNPYFIDTGMFTGAKTKCVGVRTAGGLARALSNRKKQN